MNIDEENFKVHISNEPIKLKKRKLENETLPKKVKIPIKFINHILSLGFNKDDARRLYESKGNWTGLNSGGKVRCAERGCKFTVKLDSYELFKHCRAEHKWGKYPCSFENCKFIAYSKTALKIHKSCFHSGAVTRSKCINYRCSRPDCKEGVSIKFSFLKKLLLILTLFKRQFSDRKRK